MELTDLISNVGFPIACCVVLFIQNSKLQEALNHNTEALIELKNNIKGNNNGLRTID